MERARSVGPQFSISDAGEAGAVVEICRLLTGILLAIELIARMLDDF